METTWLADLQALSRTLNFSRAAQIRNITQPAFGRRIRALEDWCGAPLFDRSGHRLTPTPAGLAMLAAADEVLGRLDQVRAQIARAQAATATLTLAATHALSFTFFPSWITALGGGAATRPMRLLSDAMTGCAAMMRAGEAQFLLCHHHAQIPTGLPPADFEQIVLARDRLVPVSAREGTERDGIGRALHRLPGTAARPVPQIGYEAGSGMGRILAAAMPAGDGALHLVPRFSSHLAMAVKALAIEGKGVGWIPDSLARDQTGPGGRLADAGSGRWQVPVDIALFRPRAPLGAAAERFWQQARAGAHAGAGVGVGTGVGAAAAAAEVRAAADRPPGP